MFVESDNKHYVLYVVVDLNVNTTYSPQCRSHYDLSKQHSVCRFANLGAEKIYDKTILEDVASIASTATRSQPA
jgi:hypothetical protein